MEEEENQSIDYFALGGFCHYCIMIALSNLNEMESKTAKEFVELVEKMHEEVQIPFKLPSIDLAYEVCGYPRKTNSTDEEPPIIPF